MGTLSEWEKEIPAPRLIREPYVKLRAATGRLFRNPVFIVALVAAVLLAAFLLRLDAAQRLVIALGSRAKGSPLNAEVWHGRFERWGLALVTSPLFILFLLYAARMRLCPEGKRKTFDFVFLCSAYVIWLVFAGYTGLRHEPWMDELFVYVKARDLSVAQLLADVKVDGNFALWSILLSPLVKAGCPVEILTCVSFGLCAVIVLLLFTKSPFSVYEKAAFAFTTAVSYHYPVVSRPYILFALLTFLLASLWEKRTEHPLLTGTLIALMAHTHLYAEGFVGILTLYILIYDIIIPWKTLGTKDKRRRLTGLALACLGVLLAAILVVPAVWTSDVVSGNSGRMDLNLKAFFSNWIWEDLSEDGIPVAIVLVCLSVCLFYKSRSMFCVFAAAFAYMLFFHIFIYFAGVPNRGSMWLFILVFTFWNALRKNGGGRPVLPLLLLFVIAIRPSWNFRDWEEEYSGEKHAGAYIVKTIAKDETLYTMGTNLFSVYTEGYDVKSIAPLYASAAELDKSLDGVFSRTQAGSCVLVLSKARTAGFTYPEAYRWEELYQSPDIMAQIFQFSVLRVYR